MIDGQDFGVVVFVHGGIDPYVGVASFVRGVEGFERVVARTPALLLDYVVSRADAVECRVRRRLEIGRAVLSENVRRRSPLCRGGERTLARAGSDRWPAAAQHLEADRSELDGTAVLSAHLAADRQEPKPSAAALPARGTERPTRPAGLPRRPVLELEPARRPQPRTRQLQPKFAAEYLPTSLPVCALSAL
jgi:hypothetical protein